MMKRLISAIFILSILAGNINVNGEERKDNTFKELTKIEITGMRNLFKGEASFEILGFRMDEHVVHYRGEKDIKFHFNINYTVKKSANIYLTTENDKGDRWWNWNLGYCPYWVLHNYTHGIRSALYGKEKIFLTSRTHHDAVVPIYSSSQIEGGKIKKGVCGVIGLYWLFYIMDADTGKYIDHANLLKRRQGELWMNFNRIPKFARALVFLLANLKEFKIYISDFHSNWKKGGFFTVRLKLKDADGDIFDIPRADVKGIIISGKKKKKVLMEPVFSEDGVPQGYFKGKIPSDLTPEKIEIKAKIVCLDPRERRVVKNVSGVFKKGEGICNEIKEPLILLTGKKKEIKFERTSDGIIRETRGCAENYYYCLMRKEEIDKMMERLAKANFNVLIPLHPLYSYDNPPKLPDGTDRLSYIIKKAHSMGLEVHPFGGIVIDDKIPEKYRMVDEKGNRLPAGDVHNPEFRKWVVDRLCKLVKKYDIDGIMLDYIRTGEFRCFCKECRKKFFKKFNKKMEEAGVDEWIKWQEEGVALLVKEIYENLKKIKPDLIISAWCIDPPQKRGGQRGPEWVNKGFLDIVAQGAYWYDTQMRVGIVGAELSKIKDKTKLYPTLGTFTRFYIYGGEFDGSDRDPLTLVKEVELMRNLGVKGFFFFTYYDMIPEFKKLGWVRRNRKRNIQEGRMIDSGYKGCQLDALREGPFKEKAIPYFRKKALYR